MKADTAHIIEEEKNLARKIFRLDPDAELVLNTEGWMSRVFIYNRGEYVIKFPIEENSKREYETEIKALKYFLSPLIDIPEIIAVWDNFSYIAYKGLTGQSLSTATELSEKKKCETGTILGEYLKELHTKTPHGFGHFGINEEIDQIEKDFELGRNYLKIRFGQEQFRRLEKFMTETFSETVTKLGEMTVFSHGDLGYWNIILQDNGRIGIIDFGDADYYDHSKDFLGMDDPVMLNCALKAYGYNELLRRKVKIRQIALPIIELPYYIGRNDDVNTEAAFRKIELGLKDIGEFENI